MRKLLTLVVATAMGLSSAAFTTETAIPAKTASPAKTTKHHKKQHKNTHKKIFGRINKVSCYRFELTFIRFYVLLLPRTSIFHEFNYMILI